MTAAGALTRLEAAGVRLALRPDGTVAMQAAAPPAPDLLAEARQHRDGIAAVLRLRAAGGAVVDDPDEREAIQAEPPLPPPGSPERARLDARHAAEVAGLRRVALMRPASWADPASAPPPGAFCSCCQGSRWWGDARGWRCWACHPPDGLAPGAYRECRA